jgi:hypothetical protein
MPRRLTDQDTVPTMRAARLEPLEPYPGSQIPWRCRCLDCGAEVRPHYNSVQQGRGCPECGKSRRRYRVDEDDARQLMTNAGFVPLEDFPGSKNPWRCILELTRFGGHGFVLVDHAAWEAV